MMKRCPDTFRELPYNSGITKYLSRDYEIRGVILRIVKTNTIVRRPVNKLFRTENIYQDTNQTDKAREQK